MTYYLKVIKSYVHLGKLNSNVPLTFFGTRIFILETIVYCIVYTGIEKWIMSWLQNQEQVEIDRKEASTWMKQRENLCQYNSNSYVILNLMFPLKASRN